jgi:hypothetical protein
VFSTWVKYCKNQENVSKLKNKMNKFVDIAYPCMWAVPEATTEVVSSLVRLHHAELTV